MFQPNSGEFRLVQEKSPSLTGILSNQIVEFGISTLFWTGTSDLSFQNLTFKVRIQCHRGILRFEIAENAAISAVLKKKR